ncbi:MAG: serine hydrolase, partial [Myxococcales bacterium]|nr:serine hydrolase [Myxococcales bacterium]
AGRVIFRASMRRFEFKDGKSNKFWEITLSGDSFTTTYGKIGTAGQSTSKSFADAAKAKAAYDKAVAEKTKKGYALVDDKGGGKSGGKSAAKADDKPAAKAKGKAKDAGAGKPLDARNPALEAAIAELFVEEGELPLHTRAVVVVQDGRLLAERYAPGFDADTPQLGWSMSKSVTSALVGVLVGRGEVDIDQPIGFAEWSEAGDPRAALTWDQLLRMSSGLAFNEDYGLRSDVTVMLFDYEGGSELALNQPLAVAPDTQWSYSSGTTNLISRAMRERFADDDAYHRFPYEALFTPLGMRSAVFEVDPTGTFVGSSYVYATPRDWARFGQLFLQDGVWQDQRILPEGWVKRSTTPSPTHPDAGYGLQWWLNAADDPDKRQLPGLPQDSYLASGHQGQMVLVVPSRKAVIVRHGMTNGRPWPRAEFATAVLAALP